MLNKNVDVQKHVIRSYLIVKCLEVASLGWISSTYVLFLIQRGLTAAQTTQVNTIFMISNFFFDLPTGALADIVGQFPIYIIGLLIFSGGTFLYGLGTNFTQFAFCEGTSAVGTSLMSEALESLLTNIVGVEKAKVTMSKEGVYTRLATIPAALLGGILGARFGLQVPWFFASATLLAAAIYGLLTLRRYHVKPRGDAHNVIGHVNKLIVQIKSGTVLIVSKKETRKVLYVVASLSFFTQAVNMFWAPVLEAQAGSTWWLGLFFVAILLATAFGSKLAKSISSTPFNFGVVLSLVGLPMALIPILPKNVYITISLFLLHEIGRGVMPIITYAYLNKFIPDEQRSTANSAKGSIERLSRAGGLLIAGTMTFYMPLITTWLVSGVCLIAVGLVIIKNSRK